MLLLKNAQSAVMDVITAIVREGKEDVYLFCDDTAASPRNGDPLALVIAYLQERKLPYVVRLDPPMAVTCTTGSSCDAEDSTSVTGCHNVVYVLHCPSEDTWARDTGPTFVIEQDRLDSFHPTISITGSTAPEDDNDGNMTIPPTTPTGSTTTYVDTDTSMSGTTTTLIGLDWEFNAYGGEDDGCYWPCIKDEQIAYRMIQSLQQHIPNIPTNIQQEKVASLILEGGSIHTDGQGTILTTKECLLHPNRNPQLTQNEMEQIILQATGCTKMIWLDHGLAYDDDTNGHIDNWACFVKPGHIVLAWTDDINNDPINYQRCRESMITLQNSTDAHNRSLTIHKLHLPSPPIQYTNPVTTKEISIPTAAGTSSSTTTTVLRVPGTQMAASYVNFYIANEAVVVPQFGDMIYDQKAIELLQLLFSDTTTTGSTIDSNAADESLSKKTRTVVGIQSSRHILYGGGNIHCITQQIPAV
jgi:agmatine deiminase